MCIRDSSSSGGSNSSRNSGFHHDAGSSGCGLSIMICAIVINDIINRSVFTFCQNYLNVT